MRFFDLKESYEEIFGYLRETTEIFCAIDLENGEKGDLIGFYNQVFFRRKTQITTGRGYSRETQVQHYGNPISIQWTAS